MTERPLTPSDDPTGRESDVPRLSADLRPYSLATSSYDDGLIPSPAHRSVCQSMTRRYLRAVVVILMLLASCGADEGVNTTAPATSTPVATTSTPTTADGQTTVSESTTSTEKDPQAPGSLVLRGDGLGIVDFGQPAEEVAQILEQVIGSSATDSGSEADWIEFVGWRDLGLYLGFDKPASSEFTGVSRFVGWDYASPDGLGLLTDKDVGIGSSLSEVRAAYGDRVQIDAEPDECFGGWTYRLVSQSGEVELVGTLDRSPADDARITSAHAGIGVGC